jgi:hypothetical protein
MAVPLVLGVVGFEQILHIGFYGPPVYQAVHWLSDSLLALPLGFLAIWLGIRLANWQRLDAHRSSSSLARACCIAIVFAVLLITGSIAHDQIDSLTHAHTAISVHAHGGIPATRDWRDPAVLAATLLHAFSDGLTGQLVGLPLLLAALAWIGRRRARRQPTATAALHTEGMIQE